MEKQHPINEMMSTTMEKIRSMMDANTIIGDPIQTGEVTLIPVSRLSFGFASGGSDFVTKNQKPGAENTFGGGSGASAKMEPVAFLIIKGDSVKLLPVDPPPVFVFVEGRTGSSFRHEPRQRKSDNKTANRRMKLIMSG